MEYDVLVVGGGAAGVDAATEVRTRAPDARIALISPGEDLIYRPWLIYLPAAAVASGDLHLPMKSIAKKFGFTHTVDLVTAVDISSSTVRLESGTTMSYRQLILAPGAPADRTRIDGAEEYALFPCDPADAMELCRRLSESEHSTVAFVLTGERIGPGLEYLAWIARAERGQEERSIRILAIEDGDAMDRQFGESAAAKIVKSLEGMDIQFVRHAAVARIGRTGITVADAAYAADIVAVTSPLHGPALGLPAELLNDRGLLRVSYTLSVPGTPNVYAAGDFAEIADLGLPKSWVMARLQAGAAARNAAAGLQRKAPVNLDIRRVRRMAGLSMPDLGGTTVLVRNRRPVVCGPLPLLMRYRMDAKYLSLYRSNRGAIRPSLSEGRRQY